MRPRSFWKQSRAVAGLRGNEARPGRNRLRLRSRVRLQSRLWFRRQDEWSEFDLRPGGLLISALPRACGVSRDGSAAELMSGNHEEIGGGDASAHWKDAA